MEVPFAVQAAVGARDGVEVPFTVEVVESHNLDSMVAELLTVYCDGCARSQAYRQVLDGSKGVSSIRSCDQCPVSKMDNNTAV